MLSRTDDEMDVDEDFVEGVSDENSDGLEQNSEEDADGEEDEENEDDAPNPEETYAGNEIEGDFEWAFLFKQRSKRDRIDKGLGFQHRGEGGRVLR